MKFAAGIKALESFMRRVGYLQPLFPQQTVEFICLITTCLTADLYLRAWQGMTRIV